MPICFVYLLVVNIFGFLLFVYDKNAAKHKRQRIPKKILHLFEAIGAVFFILLSMYFIRHKNQKASYFLITYLIFALWVAAILYYSKIVPF